MQPDFRTLSWYAGWGQVTGANLHEAAVGGMIAAAIGDAVAVGVGDHATFCIHGIGLPEHSAACGILYLAQVAGAAEIIRS